MSAIQAYETVGAIVARRPALSRVFESAGIDYCCGGKKSIEEACLKKGIDPAEFVNSLEVAEQSGDEHADVDAAAMSLTDLADHIEQTHHGYLKSELPRLDAMTKKVAAVHGGEDPRLEEIRQCFVGFANELSMHMQKEERILFPMVRAIDAGSASAFHCGSISNPIRQMEHEHDESGSALARMRELSDGFQPPDWACNTYRAMLDALTHLEQDLHLHIHKENNVLFPRAIEMEMLAQCH